MESPGTDAERRPDSLTSGTAHATLYEVGAYVLSVLLRLGSNLILTRLLMPEAFGLMAMMATVTFVLWMLSEVGLSQAVIMSPRGDDPAFLDTVYALQALRGVGLWVVASLLAFPMALFFKGPDLLWILPIGSLQSVLHGFASTRVYSLRRRVRPLPVLTLELVCSALGLAVNVTGAWLGLGVKILVASMLLSTAVFASASHFLPGVSDRNHLRIDATARQEILYFGRWIFFSSALTAVAQRGDQVLLGRLIGAAGLGIYNIALALAEMPEALINNVVSGVVQPTLARVKNADPASFTKVYYGLRAWMDPLVQIGLGGLIALSDWIVDLLYDDRYLSAASMLRILAVRTSVAILAAFCESCFIAHGESEFSFRRNLFVSVVLMIAMPVGSMLAGLSGVLWGSVVARATALLALWPTAHRRGFLRIGRELLALPYLALGYALGKALALILPAV